MLVKLLMNILSLSHKKYELNEERKRECKWMDGWKEGRNNFCEQCDKKKKFVHQHKHYKVTGSTEGRNLTI